MFFKTSARQLHDNLGKEVETFRPWQYEDCKITSINYDAIFDDITTYWNEQARFREGFKIEENNITIPNFFTKINGLPKDKKSYDLFIKEIVNTPNTFIIDDNFNFCVCSILQNNLMKNDPEHFLYTYEEYNSHVMGEPFYYELTTENILNNKLLGYSFRDYDSNYTFNQLTSYKQKIIVNLIKDYIEKNKNKKSEEDIESFIKICLSIPEEIIVLINNFDYSFEVPKIVVISEKLNKNISLLLYILNQLAFDILILKPNGKSNIEKYLDINELSLGYFVQDYNIDKKIVDTSERVKEQVISLTSKFDKLKENWLPTLILGIATILTLISLFILKGIIANSSLIVYLVILGFLILEVEDWNDNLFNFWHILLCIIIIIILIGKLFVFIFTCDSNPDKHQGFQTTNIQEEIGNQDYVIVYNPDAISIKDYSYVYCYIENNAKNTQNVYIKAMLGNSVVYESKDIKPLEYLDYLKLNIDLPLGENEITIKYYVYDDTNVENPYTDILLGSTTLNVHTIEGTSEYTESKETYKLDFINH